MRTTVVLVAAAGLAGACVSDLDTTREPVDRGSFGETLMTLACKRVAYLEDLADGDAVVDVRGDRYRAVCREGLAPPEGAPARLGALLAKRSQLIAAVDTAFPDRFLDPLQSFLTNADFLALYDGGEIVTGIDDLVEALRWFADDPGLAPALARLTHRHGYQPPAESLGAVRAVAGYPELEQLLDQLLNAVTDGGPAEPALDAVIAALGVTLRNATATAEPGSDDRTGRLAVDLLLGERSQLGGDASLPIVRRDHRGVARVADLGGGGAIAFADADGDGLADIDDLGRYVGADGALLAAPSPFPLLDGDSAVPWTHRDDDGRALVEDDGAPLYRYVDLDRTLLAALARDAAALFDPDRGTAFDLLRGTSALVSSRPRAEVTRYYDNGERLTYRGYDTAESPLLDLAHGYLSLLTAPDADDLLALVRDLLVDHESVAARLVEAVIDAKEIAVAHDEAQMEPRAPFADDLVPVLRRILAVPGLGEDVMRALEDPAVAGVSLRIRDLMAYRDRFTYDADHRLVGSLSTPVDRAAPDRGFNRSLAQRLMHLLDDAHGAVLCNKQGGQVKDPLGLGIPLSTYDECELIRIDNVAVLFVQSMAYARDASGRFRCASGAAVRNGDGFWRCPDGGRPVGKARLDFHWNNLLIEAIVSDRLIERMTTIDGFTSRPTPEALARALFLDPMPTFLADVMDPGETRHGERFIDVHSGTLPVFEVDHGYDHLQPLVQAFADHDAEGLFVDLLSVLHRHWPSRASAPTHQFDRPHQAGYAWGSGGVSYEAAIVEILSRGDAMGGGGNLVDALHEVAPTLNHMTVGGRASVDVLVAAARYAFEPRPGLANRRGETVSETVDGAPIGVLSPVQLLLDGYARKRARLAVTGDEGQAWQRSIGHLADTFLRAEPTGDGGWQFSNPRVSGVGVALIDFVRRRLEAHAGDRDTWLLTTLPGDLEDIATGPVTAAAADLVLALGETAGARQQLEGLVAYLMDEGAAPAAFRLSLVSVADLLQLALDDRDLVPIARAVGEVIDPQRGWVDSQLELVGAAVATDDAGVIARLVAQLYGDTVRGHTAISALIDGISEVHRARPYVELGASYTAEDYRSLLRGVADFLADNRRGLRRFISIVEGRNVAP